MQLLENAQPATIVDSAPNPTALRPGQSRLERIRERGVIRIGFDPDRLPFSYFNTEKALVGFDIDMELRQIKNSNMLGAENLAHVTRRWPNFRDWLISKSGHTWTAEETRGRAEAEGINIEALSITDAGTVMMGFRGPLTSEGGAMAIEFKLPDSPDHEPVLSGNTPCHKWIFRMFQKAPRKRCERWSKSLENPESFTFYLGPKDMKKRKL